MLFTVVRLVMPVGPTPLTTALVTLRMVTETPGDDTMLMTSEPCIMARFCHAALRQLSIVS